MALGKKMTKFSDRKYDKRNMKNGGNTRGQVTRYFRCLRVDYKATYPATNPNNGEEIVEKASKRLSRALIEIIPIKGKRARNGCNSLLGDKIPWVF